MHDDLEPFSQSPSQKFHKNSTNFEKSQKIFKKKKPKLIPKCMKCMKNER